MFDILDEHELESAMLTTGKLLTSTDLLGKSLLIDFGLALLGLL
jgi:hypothetical protein